MNIRVSSFVAILIVSIMVMSAAAPAWSATAPETAERKRSQAPEAFKLNITKVFVEETEGHFKDVLMEALVTGVLRTASGVKPGETIVIKSRRRNMTEEQVRGSIESFSEPPIVLGKGWSGSAYLRPENTTTTLKAFGTVLEGFSFVSDESRSSESAEPHPQQPEADKIAKMLNEVDALVNESRPAEKNSTRRPKDGKVPGQLAQPGAEQGGAELVFEPYDGKIEAPCPPEAIASLVDPLTKGEADSLLLALVPHRYPSTMPVTRRAMWVCMRNGQPLWIIDSPPRTRKNESAGITAAALKRARAFLAEREELKGKEKLTDWKPEKETLLPSYQSETYGLQITEMKLIDKESESWEITAKPINENARGGEIWMRFSKEHDISAEYGR